MNKYIPGFGNDSARIVVVGEAPSYDEEQTGRPFTGPSGRLLDSILINAGINRNELWVTNVFKKMIMPQVRKGKPIPAHIRAQQAGLDVQESLSELRREIDQIKPNVIVPLGGTALWAFRGTYEIAKWRGSILPAWNYKIVSSYHPANLIEREEGKGEYWHKYVIEFDLKRAKKESYYPDIRVPKRNLQICRNSAQLYNFYERAKSRKKQLKLAVDIEALTCIPVCCSLSFDKNEGLCVPLWNQTDICKISDIPSSDLASIWQLLYNILTDPIFLIIGQNFKYDQDKMERLGFRFNKLFSDTMLKAFAIDPEFSVGLAFNTSIYTEEPYYKDEGGDFDYTKHNIDELFTYGARDAAVTLEIDDAMDPIIDEIGQRDFYEKFLMELHPMYLDIEKEGFNIDENVREKLLRKYIEWSERLKLELYYLAGEKHINVNSHTKDVPWLFWEYLKCPKRAGTGEEELTQLLAIVKKDEQKKAISNVLTQRRLEKTISTYLMGLPDFDGKQKTSYFLCLKTGRTSTGLLEPPIRPRFDVRDKKGHLKKKYIGAGFQVLTKHGDIGGDIREQYIPDKDHVFVNIDGSQAEARVIARLARDEKMLAMYDTNDVHALTASWFFGGTEATHSKKVLGYESPIRFVGKTLRHAGHLGAKKRRASLEVNTSARKYNIDISITEAFADICLKKFHKNCPNIQEVFHKEVIEAIEKTRILIAPLPYGIEAKYGGRRTFYERWGDELFREAFSYLPQRAVSDNTKNAGLRIRKIIKGIKIVVESHDALTFMMPENMLDEWIPICQEEFERPIIFENCSLPREPLVIPAEVEIGYNYKDLKKWKKKI